MFVCRLIGLRIKILEIYFEEDFSKNLGFWLRGGVFFYTVVVINDYNRE